MRVLITGGCGFIGHHVVEHIIKNTDWQVVVLDKLTYASSGFDRLRDINCFDDKRIKVFTADFTNPIPTGLVQEIGDIDYILHLGAETHVDRSIETPMDFVRANVVGTCVMLDYARSLKGLRRFVYFSTDEVFGPAPGGVFHKEWDHYNSSNPYAATKAGGEELALAYANTYKLPVTITHTMNCYGERQHPEKFIPSSINKILRGETVVIHSDPSKTKAGSRFYIHCRNVASALLYLLEHTEGLQRAEKFNIVGECEVDNLTLVQFIARVLCLDLKYEMVDFHSSRPGHDLRYALDGTKLERMGWRAPVGFEQSLEKTIRWYLKPENSRWLNWR